MMKKIIVSVLILFGVCPAYSQTISLDKKDYDTMIQEIYNLKQELATAITSNENYTSQAQRSLRNLKDSVRFLRASLDELEKFKSDKNKIDTQLKIKTDSINLLKTQLSDERQKGRRTASDERKRGKNEALESIVRAYKNPKFDDLIESSTKESVQRDLHLAGDNPDIKQTLSDLDKYFSAKELLTKRYDEYAVNNALNQLKTVNQHSALLDKLKENVENYGNFSKGMKETINKIAELDKRESVAGTGKNIENQKFNKILTAISLYIFNYDFNLSDYPFLSNILLEVIKRKQPDPDADITDLLQKL